MTWDLYAIHSATNPRRIVPDNLMVSLGYAHDQPMPMDFSVLAAVQGTRAILICNGADQATCTAHGHDFLRCSLAGLRMIGVLAVLFTPNEHHAGNFQKFPGRKFHDQFREIAHATGPSTPRPSNAAPATWSRWYASCASSMVIEWPSIAGRAHLEHIPFERAHHTRFSLLFFDHLYPIKRFRLIG